MAQKRWVFYVGLVLICGCGDGITTFRDASPPSDSEVEQNVEESPSAEEPAGEELGDSLATESSEPEEDALTETAPDLQERSSSTPRAPSRVVITPRSTLAVSSSEVTDLEVPPPQVHRGNAPYNRLALAVVPQEDSERLAEGPVLGEEASSTPTVEVFEPEKVVTPPEVKEPSVVAKPPKEQPSPERELAEVDTEGLGVVTRTEPSSTPTSPSAPSVSSPEVDSSSVKEEENLVAAAPPPPLSTEQLLQDYYAMQREERVVVGAEDDAADPLDVEGQMLEEESDEEVVVVARRITPASAKACLQMTNHTVSYQGSSYNLSKWGEKAYGRKSDVKRLRAVMRFFDFAWQERKEFFQYIYLGDVNYVVRAGKVYANSSVVLKGSEAYVQLGPGGPLLAFAQITPGRYELPYGNEGKTMKFEELWSLVPYSSCLAHYFDPSLKRSLGGKPHGVLVIP